MPQFQWADLYLDAVQGDRLAAMLRSEQINLSLMSPQAESHCLPFAQSLGDLARAISPSHRAATASDHVAACYAFGHIFPPTRFC